MIVDPPGFGTISGNSFPIQQSQVAPIPVSGLTAADIEQMFSFLPEAGLVAQSGAAHTEAGQILGSIADALVKHVQVLHENWSGTAAQAAVSNFEQLHQTAIGLAQASSQTGAVLNWLSGTITPFRSYQAPGKGNSADEAARAAMNEFNGYLVTANSNLPTKVTKNLPTTDGYDAVAPLVGGPGGGVAAGAAAAAASPTAGNAGVSAAQANGGGVTGVGNNGGGSVGQIGGVSPSSGTGTTTPTTKLAGLPPGTSTTGTGTGTPSGSVPGGSVPGGNTGPTGTDPLGTIPVPTGTTGTLGSDNPGNPAPADGDEAVGLGSASNDGGDPALGGLSGDNADPVGLVNVPGENGNPGLNGFAGDNAEPVGLGGMPGEDGGMMPFGSMSGDPSIGGVGGVGGGSSGFGGNGAGGQGLIAEDITGDSPADGAVIGPDGMIGTGPGGPDAGMDGAFGSGDIGVGNSGATGFVGADDALGDPMAGSGGGFPVTGGSGSGESAKERRRQAWMMEDKDIWEGRADHVPSHIGA